MIRQLSFFLGLMFLLLGNAIAQQSITSNAVTYETLYDDPYDINKLYVHIQPLYGEFFTTNINIGFGAEIEYYLEDKLNFDLSFRKAYGQKFDFIRDVAEKNNDGLNPIRNFYFGEIGATYHIRDGEESSKSKFILYSKRYRERNKWESMVPQYITTPGKVRKFYGVRGGGLSYQSAIDVNTIIRNQGEISLDTLGGISAYSSIRGHGFFIGGEMQIIKNISIDFDKTYDQVTNDLVFTTYVDILILPFTSVDDILYRADPGAPDQIISGDLINKGMLGGRAGIKGKFNRDLSFGYNIELGLRPGVKGQGFYALGRLSFPLIGSKMEKEVEAFGQ